MIFAANLAQLQTITFRHSLRAPLNGLSKYFPINQGMYRAIVINDKRMILIITRRVFILTFWSDKQILIQEAIKNQVASG